MGQQDAEFAGFGPVEVQGMSARLPQARPGVVEWDAPRAAPLQRWDVEYAAQEVAGLLPPRFGSFIDDVASFDSAAFSLSRCDPTGSDFHFFCCLHCIKKHVLFALSSSEYWDAWGPVIDFWL